MLHDLVSKSHWLLLHQDYDHWWHVWEGVNNTSKAYKNTKESELMMPLTTRYAFWEGGDTCPLLHLVLGQAPRFLGLWMWRVLPLHQLPFPVSTGHEDGGYKPSWRPPRGIHTPVPADPHQNTPLPVNKSHTCWTFISSHLIYSKFNSWSHFKICW